DRGARSPESSLGRRPSRTSGERSKTRPHGSPAGVNRLLGVKPVAQAGEEHSHLGCGAGGHPACRTRSTLNKYWDNATRGCLAPQRQTPGLGSCARLGAVEIAIYAAESSGLLTFSNYAL